MLVTSKELLLKAQEGGYAVGAFNVENMEMVMAVVEAAEELKKYTSFQNMMANGALDMDDIE